MGLSVSDMRVSQHHAGLTRYGSRHVASSLNQTCLGLPHSGMCASAAFIYFCACKAGSLCGPVGTCVRTIVHPATEVARLISSHGIILP